MKPAIPVLTLSLALASLCGCTPTDGEVGIATMRVQNDSDRALAYSFSVGSRGSPKVLATTLPPNSTTAVLESSGCFGCVDRPTEVLGKMVVTVADTGATVVRLDPMANDPWKTESTGEYRANHTLTVTQAQVDAAKAP